MTTNYGMKLTPARRTRKAMGLKAERSTQQMTIDPATATAWAQVNIKFPQLQTHDVIVPGTTRLAFNIDINSTDVNRTLVNNIGRAIVQKIEVKIGNDTVTILDSSDVFSTYADLWRSNKERQNSAYQGIGTPNSMKLRVGADNAVTDQIPDNVIFNTYGNRFAIPLDFSLLSGHAPFHPAGLKDWFTYTVFFAANDKVIKSTDVNASYTLKNLTLEYDVVNHEALSNEIRQKYMGSYPVHFTDIQRYKREQLDLTSPVWTIHLNLPRRSTNAAVLLFVNTGNDGNYTRDPEIFVNPNIQKVDVTIEGVPNQLYAQGMRSYQQWDEAHKVFGSGGFAMGGGRRPETNAVAKDLNMSATTLLEYLTTIYVLILDLRSTDDTLHGNGRKRKRGNGSVGMTIEINRTAAAVAGKVWMYYFVLSDKQLNFRAVD